MTHDFYMVEFARGPGQSQSPRCRTTGCKTPATMTIRGCPGAVSHYCAKHYLEQEIATLDGRIQQAKHDLQELPAKLKAKQDELAFLTF